MDTTDSTVSSSTTAVKNHIYQFKVALEYIKPPIWRRIEIPENYDFYELHVAIQDIMNWSGDHLHKFEMVKPKNSFNTSDEYIGIPEPYLDGIVRILPEKYTKISDQFNLTTKNKCNYLYDFGSQWHHIIILEKIFEALPNVKYPRCTAGRRQAPPEDEDEEEAEAEHVEAHFSKDEITFRDPEVVWNEDPFQKF